MLQSQMATSGPSQAPADSQEAMVEAPPKQVAMAMDRLAHAARLIADIRISADRFLEALFVAASLPHPLSDKPLRIILNQEESIRLHLHDLRSVGRQLEAAGVLNGSMRSRGNSWGLHMPLVCPDGAVVAYAWKRQLAGQAGASAVDRTRLALKAFTDQKKRFFPHIEDEPVHNGDLQAGKKQCRAQKLSTSHMAVFNEERNLSDVLIQLEKEAPQICIFTYQRLDWLKRSSSLSMLANENSLDTSKEQVFHASNNLRTGSLGAVAVEQIAVIELLVPSVFRAIISLHPAGSINPDAVAFFSPDEGGDYIHARGFSVYHIYRKITEHADKALQYFLAMKPDTSLDHLLHWICTYQTLFIKVCSACGRLLMMDKQLGLLLPPVCHPYRQLMSNNQNSDDVGVYHIRCLPGQA